VRPKRWRRIYFCQRNVIGKGGRNACCDDNGANQTHDEVRARDYYFAASENKHGSYEGFKKNDKEIEK
jgi:hypothetical protein